MAEKTDVAFFLNNLKGGGIQRFVVNLASEFSRHGLSVDVVVANPIGPFIKYLKNENTRSSISLVTLDNPRVRKIPLKLAEYLRQNKPSAMIANMHYNNEMAILARRIAGVSTQIVVVEHNTLPPIKGVSLTQPKFSLGLHPDRANLLINIFYPWANQIIATSQGVADDLVRISHLSASKLQVIYNPIITSELREKSQQPLENPWFSANGKPVILGVGRLEPQKDFQTLVQAFSCARKEIDARLVILGSGSQYSALKSLVRELNLENSVFLPGYVDNPYTYMAKASIFVLSSAWEGFGNVLVEAMAVGTPVISTNCRSGPSEILANGEYGELVPVRNVEALSQAILKVLVEGGKKVPKQWLEQFSSKEVAKSYFRILNLDN